MTSPKKTSGRLSPALPGIYREPWVGNVILAFGCVAFLFFIASIFTISLCREADKAIAITLAAVWIVGVPTYFFFEHIVLFRKYGDPAQYEQFKRVQELAAKIWAGAIVVLAAYFTHSLK